MRLDTTYDAAPLLDASEVTVDFTEKRGLFQSPGTVRGVNKASITVARGETLGLVGESGSGKSTLARAIMGLTPITSGRVVFDGKDLARLSNQERRRVRRRMQMVFQNPYSTLDPRMSVGETVAEPMIVHGLGNPKRRREEVAELLQTVGLNADFAGRYPDALSGGQRQRVSLARALASQPELIVADEPISALDVSIQAQIVNLLRRLQRETALSFLFITHDLSIVQNISQRVAVMYFGEVVETGPSRDVCSTPLHPYSAALVSAIPRPNPALEKARTQIVLEGEVPSRVNPPSGCAFHTRCWLKQRMPDASVCSRVVPALRRMGNGRAVACHFAETMTQASEPHADRAGRMSGSEGNLT